MLKKSITYVDFNGQEVTEDFFFNFTAPELTKLAIKYGSDISEVAKEISESNDVGRMIEFMEDLILSSYGQKSEDGKRFMKSPELKSEFEYSAAYAELFEILITQPSESQAFGKGLVSGAKENKTENPRFTVADSDSQQGVHETLTAQRDIREE